MRKRHISRAVHADEAMAARAAKASAVDSRSACDPRARLPPRDATSPGRTSSLAPASPRSRGGRGEGEFAARRWQLRRKARGGRIYADYEDRGGGDGGTAGSQRPRVRVRSSCHPHLILAKATRVPSEGSFLELHTTKTLHTNLPFLRLFSGKFLEKRKYSRKRFVAD